MAILVDADRAGVWAELMRMRDFGDSGVLKAELRAAVDAVDAWVEASQAAFNAALPLPARSALTARQKAKVLMDVVSRRFGVI